VFPTDSPSSFTSTHEPGRIAVHDLTCAHLLSFDGNVAVTNGSKMASDSEAVDTKPVWPVCPGSVLTHTGVAEIVQSFIFSKRFLYLLYSTGSVFCMLLASANSFYETP